MRRRLTRWRTTTHVAMILCVRTGVCMDVVIDYMPVTKVKATEAGAAVARIILVQLLPHTQNRKSILCVAVVPSIRGAQLARYDTTHYRIASLSTRRVRWHSPHIGQQRHNLHVTCRTKVHPNRSDALVCTFFNSVCTCFEERRMNIDPIARDPRQWKLRVCPNASSQESACALGFICGRWEYSISRWHCAFGILLGLSSWHPFHKRLDSGVSTIHASWSK